MKQKHNLKLPPEPQPPTALARAFWHMAQALDQSAPSDNHLLIERFGRHHFGDLWTRPNPETSNLQP